MPLIEKIAIKKDWSAHPWTWNLEDTDFSHILWQSLCNKLSHFNKNLLNKNSLYKCEPQSFTNGLSAEKLIFEGNLPVCVFTNHFVKYLLGYI